MRATLSRAPPQASSAPHGPRPSRAASLQPQHTSPTDLSEPPLISSPRLPRRAALLGGLTCTCGACVDAQPAHARAWWYDQYFAWAMAHTMGTYEAAILSVKQRLFGELLGDAGVTSILEVGIGSGPNMAFYAPAASRLHLTGLDPNPAMQGYARDSAAHWGLSQRLHLVQGSAEALPFGGEGQPPASFDAAVVTLVLCSVPDPVAALTEIKRVVKPGGKLLVIEHVLAPQPGLLRLQQRLLDPLQGLLADGCHLTRDTTRALVAAGWDTGNRLEQFSVPGLSVIAPHIAGVLTA